MTNILWKPSQEQIRSSNMYHFLQIINNKYKKKYNSYKELYEWSINNISNFWEEIYNFTGIKFSKKHKQVLSPAKKMFNTEWFTGAKLNFAENLLRVQNDNIAIKFRGEDKISYSLTYKELYDEVSKLAKSMKKIGIEKGDRIVGFIPNMPHSVIAMLATTSLGAIWSSCSPDFGIKGVLDRFGQIKPKILFAADGYFFKGKKIELIDKISKIVKKISSIEKTVIIPYAEKTPKIDSINKSELFDSFKSSKIEKIEFEQVSFSHPLYIMYSSGTTGLPKCMIQSTGGILINHLKELILHTNLKEKDNIFYFTTCGWMMWNWLVSSLFTGATIILYDGNPFHPTPNAMWEMVEKDKITIFGTSAGYLSALENSGTKPCKKSNLSSLKTILSTGSPLLIENFKFVYSNIKSDLQLSSISGGTDLNGCFALGNPILPVYEGELQCIGLGMHVKAFNENSDQVINKTGELVCISPFPSMPILFWDDENKEKYQKAYFKKYDNVWQHGDYIIITDRGSLIFLGRSDATLNPGGVRIGTSEIYRQVEQINEIEDSIVVGQKWENDTRIILFVKVKNNKILNDEIINKIKNTIRKSASPRHVPAKIIQVKEIPYTINMKKVEIAVKKIINNEKIDNEDALKNPESLEEYREISKIIT